MKFYCSYIKSYITFGFIDTVKMNDTNRKRQSVLPLIAKTVTGRPLSIKEATFLMPFFLRKETVSRKSLPIYRYNITEYLYMWRIFVISLSLSAHRA